MLILMAGLPGTGKSTLARELARRTHGHVLDKDQIRAALFTADEIEYSTAQDDFCMEVMLQTAGYMLGKNPARKVFLDGRPFSRRLQIERVVAYAAEIAQSWCILECACSEESALQRLATADPDHPARNRDFQLYQEVKGRFEPIVHPKTVISTDQPLERCVDSALTVINQATSPGTLPLV